MISFATTWMGIALNKSHGEGETLSLHSCVVFREKQKKEAYEVNKKLTFVL